eukprot:c41529_g1_i1 orf=118-303(+)
MQTLIGKWLGFFVRLPCVTFDFGGKQIIGKLILVCHVNKYHSFCQNIIRTFLVVSVFIDTP